MFVIKPEKANDMKKSTCMMIAAITAMSGCQDIERIKDTGLDTKTVTISLYENEEVKSSLSADAEEQIRNFALYIYDPFGKLAASTTSQGTETEVTLLEGQDYTVYALVNLLEFPEAVIEEDTFMDITHPVASEDLLSTGIPMSGISTLTAEDIRSGRSYIELDRLVSRISFTIDASGLKTSTITVRSVKLIQTASAIAPFRSYFVADQQSIAAVGDISDEQDILIVNSGGTIWLYALENCQGVLLPGNTDPWLKIPSEIPGKETLCTYLEVIASYSGIYEGIPVRSDNVTYRFYLGKDNTSDFSVERNHNIGVTLKLTDMGVFDESWKIDYGNPLPVVSYSLEVTPSESAISVGESQSLTAMFVKQVDGITSSSEDVTGQAVWTAVDASKVSVNSGLVTGISGGVTDVTATYEGVTASCTMTINDVIKHVYRFIIEGYDNIIKGHESPPYEIFYYKDTYKNGTLIESPEHPESFEGPVTWSISYGSANGSISPSGILYGNEVGSLTITAALTHEGQQYNLNKTVMVTNPSYIVPETGWEHDNDVIYN